MKKSSLDMKDERFKHEPNINKCPYMKAVKCKTCPAYDKLKNYIFSESDLQHMEFYNHCDIKPMVCKYGDDCKAWRRLVNGGNRLEDRCHVNIFYHPPRVQQKKRDFPKDFKPFTFDDLYKEDKSFELQNAMALDSKSDLELLQLLMREVKRNNFGNDLFQKHGPCTSIMEVVDRKLRHKRHIAMKSPLTRPYMLALVLYTGCECNHDLCKSQREGNWSKWVVFDYVLDKAICKLSDAEYGYYPVYSGINGCMLDLNNGNKTTGWLSTFTSTSWDKRVAEQFCGDKGMIIGFGSECRRGGCDVSWISKFPDEKEILFSRGGSKGYGYCSFECVQKTKSIQYVTVDTDYEKLF